MRLLIVEDEKRLATALASGLRAEGFKVELAFDGLEGLLKATTRSFDVVLLDANLPGLNGYRLVSQLRAQGSEVAVLMLTAKSGEYDEAEGLDAGADDYLTKPFSFTVLLARLRALMRRQGRSVRTVVQIGELTIDRAARRVRRNGAEVILTSKEFAVLDHLVERRGDLVTKTDVLDQVWDPAYEGPANIVEVYVSALRRKLGTGLIQTVRGAGYRLVDDA